MLFWSLQKTCSFLWISLSSVPIIVVVVLLNSLNAMVQRTANENAAGIFLRDSFFVCPQSPYRDNDMILWIFPVVLCDAFCMWYWSICKSLVLSFSWGHHHLHLVGLDDQSITWLLQFLLYRADETQQGRNSCPRLQLLSFSLDSIMWLSR